MEIDFERVKFIYSAYRTNKLTREMIDYSKDFVREFKSSDFNTDDKEIKEAFNMMKIVASRNI